MKVSSVPWYDWTMKSTYEAALRFFNLATAKASGPNGTYCVPEPVQRRIARELQEQTGWTVTELREAFVKSNPPPAPPPATVLVAVAPGRDARHVGSYAARAARTGTVRMYPATPFH